MSARQVVVEAVVGRGGGSVVAGRSVAGCAARGCDDGGSVGGGALGVLLQVVVVAAAVERGLFVMWAGGDGGQGAVLGDDIRTHATLSPGHTLRSLSILPEGGEDTAV